MEGSPAAGMADAELAARARAGDVGAWEALVRGHEAAVFRLAFLMLGDADEAEDIAQEAFIRAYAALPRFELGRPLQPWLLRITANVARNRRRAVARYVAALRRVLQAPPPSAPSVESLSAQQWEAQTLWQAVRQLRATDQQIIYLRFFLDLSEADTAAALAVAPGTVKSRLHRALGRLRVVVEREFPGLREVRDQ